MEILKDDTIVEILGCVHRALMPYYSFYADQKSGLLSFDGFSRFCSDFEIFPDILSKPKIMRFYKTLSGFYESTGQPTAQADTAFTAEAGTRASTRRDLIDEHLFVEAIALTAFEVVYQDPQPSNAEKVSDPLFSNLLILQIILLVERLNHSQGPTRVQKAYGKTRFQGLGTSDGSDLLHFIRLAHPEFFDLSNQQNTFNQKQRSVHQAVHDAALAQSTRKTR